MKEFVICKSCGFIMPKSRLKDRCPACGVPSRMFEPYLEKVSEKRKMILELDLHPVLVHFPISFNFTILIIAVVCLILKDSRAASLLQAAMMFLVYCLPAVVIAAFIGGLIDGKIRFRKVTTHLLLTKIFLGALFFIFAAVMLCVNIFYSPGNFKVILLTAVLSAAGLAVSTVLGKIGTSLLPAKFPG
ncbi:MAG: hypothetical protein ABSG94_03685 [Brevinematales bacterium]